MIGVILITVTGLAVMFLLEHIWKQRFSVGVLLTGSFLSGLVGISWIMLLLQWLLGGWYHYPLYISLAFVLGVFWWCRARLRALIRIQPSRMAYLFVLLLSIRLFILGSAQITNDYLHSDGLVIWFMKGKIFSTHQAITVQGLRNDVYTRPIFHGAGGQTGSLIDYPVLVPLSLAFVSLIPGGNGVVAGKWLWLAVEASLVGFLYVFGGWMRGRKSWSRLVGVTVYCALPIGWSHFTPHWFGGADLWLAAMYSAALGCGYHWLRTRSDLYAFLALLLLGGAAFTKVEGLTALLFLPIFVLCRRSRPFLPTLGGVIVLIGLPLMWYGWLKAHELGTLAITMSAARILPAARVVFLNWFNVPRYLGLFGIIWGCILFTLLRRGLGLWLLPVSIMVGGFLFMVISYAGSTMDFADVVVSSLPRLFSQWAPTAIVVGYICWAELFPVDRGKVTW